MASGERLALLGFGRFGRALATLAREAGFDVRAHDPFAEVPEPLRASTPAELVLGAEAVALAVPVPAVDAAVESLAPVLEPRTLVVDVSSVKLAPIRAMERHLEGRVPWLASHPLFGPSSIARGERPLRVVVCPNEAQPEALARGTRLYERLGCSVIVQDADAHDRAMAYSHALAFFVAKGMLDIGAGESVEVAPPSFQAMAQTIDAVRSDAGHLFSAIGRENPYAAPARQELLEALARAHEQLAADDEEQASVAPPAIPDIGARAPALKLTRELIDELDRELVTLLARRAQLARRAGSIKHEHGHGVRDPGRERALLDARRLWARDCSLDPEAIADIFTAVLRFSRGAQRPQQDGGPRE